jgi:hypothetical protein
MVMKRTNVTIEQIASKALQGEDRLLRGMVMALLRENPALCDITRPQTDDQQILAASASLLELFAERYNQSPPEWTKEIGPLTEPIYLVNGIGKESRRLVHRMADAQSPEPLRKRGFLATANYLTFV